MKLSRVVVLASRPIEGNTVSQLIKIKFITERGTPGRLGPFYKGSRQDPKATYG
jgi:hypothetical protein